MKISIFWFRRDLRLKDNTALNHALKSGLAVLPVFIFDDHILEDLPPDDARVSFIYSALVNINAELNRAGSSIKIYKGKPTEVWKRIIEEFSVSKVFVNKDYEPYATERDYQISTFLKNNGIEIHFYKDQVIFEENDILKMDGTPYTVFTPYKNKWREQFDSLESTPNEDLNKRAFVQKTHDFPSLSEIGFNPSTLTVRTYDLSNLDNYGIFRNFPAEDVTSRLGPHLRFGTVSIRQVIHQLTPNHSVFLDELIWREFFMQIIYHFPHVVNSNFHSKYDRLEWRNQPDEFKSWCEGRTGYPLVDAGMRQLNATGFMHNRVRMVTASFLCKHLLIDWKWGEAYFAAKLLDYELASNNGNWQWAAGTGCDAAPYFRIFNPAEQVKKFDKDLKYIKQWVQEYGTSNYPDPMVEHQEARKRALMTYGKINL